MDQTTAVRRLSRLLGRAFAYRVNAKALTAEGRAGAAEALKEAQTVRDAIKKQKEDRFESILAGDSEYQRLKAEFKVAQKTVADLAGAVHARRITVGTTSNLAGFGVFHVTAEGDNWQEIVDAVEKKAKAKSAA